MEGLDWCGVLKEMRKQPVRMEEVFVPQQRTVTVPVVASPGGTVLPGVREAGT